MIIHFTNKLENLISIISTKSFLLHYCGEYIGDKKGRVVSQAAHPMVSFSEYKHNKLQYEIITYGNYGIAISKDWARKNGISPVSYVEKGSPAAKGLITLLKARQTDQLPKELRLPIIQLKCFTKHVIGYNSYVNDENFNFKSENEWRFVPTKKQINGNLISINLTAYNKKKDTYNEKIKSYSLRFSLRDIKYIYVENETEREKIVSLFGFSKSKVVLSTWKK